MHTTLISVEQLRALQASNSPYLVFDCSFELTNPAAADAAYRAAHIPGAVQAHLDRHLSDMPVPDAQGRMQTPPDAASGGRHPLPRREKFAAWLSSVGFSNDMQAVVYDRNASSYAPRLWWMLRWAGQDAVAVLDGGLQAWQAAGGSVEQGEAPARAPARFELRPARGLLAVTATVLDRLGRPDQTVLDARAPARFRGDNEPMDPVAGHIPGALNRQQTENFTPEGRFKPAAQLREEFLRVLGGRDPSTVVHQCGSGVGAVPNLLAMEIAGLGTTALYAGSWSEWCSDPSRPVERGEPAGR